MKTIKLKKGEGIIIQSIGCKFKQSVNIIVMEDGIIAICPTNTL